MAGWQPQDWQPRERPLEEAKVEDGVVYNTNTKTGTLKVVREPLEIIELPGIEVIKL